MKKGFTLIELLAVIVILAIIALIATPIILGIIEDARSEAKVRSAENVIHTASLYYSRESLNLNFDSRGNKYSEVMKMVDGEHPDSGIIYINKKGEVGASLRYEDKCYIKEYKSSELRVEQYDVTKASCPAPLEELMVNPMPQILASTFLGSSEITRNQVEKIEIKDEIDIPEGAYNWEVSENGGVKAWYIDSDENGLYELYIGQEGGVIANPDSSYLFFGFTNLTSIDLSGLNTTYVTNMHRMFAGTIKLTSLDLSNFNTENVTDMSWMFAKTGLTSLDLSNFNTQKVTNMSSMFKNCTSLTNLNLSNFNTENVNDMSDMFSGCSALTSLNLSNFNTENVNDMNGMFLGCSALASLDLSNFNTENVNDMALMFKNCTSLTNITFNENFKTSNVVKMQGMFRNCTSLTSLNLSTFTVEKVDNLQTMFSGCTSLETIDLSNADLGNVNNPFNNIEYRASAVFGNDNSSVCEGEGESKICGLDAYPYCANLSEIIVKNDNAKIWLDAKLNTSGNDEISNKYTLCYYKEHTLNNPCLVDMVKINSNTSQ